MFVRETLNQSNEQLISWPKILMICAGLWDQPISTRQTTNKIFHLYSWFMRFNWFFFYAQLVLELLRLIIQGYETQIVIRSLTVVISCSKIMFKALIYIKNDVMSFFSDVIEKEREVWDGTDEEIKDVYRGKIQFVRSVVVALGLANSGTMFLLEYTGVYATLSVREHNRLHNSSLEPHFMYQVLFPLNRGNHLHWFISTQVLWAWVGLIYSIVTQLIYVIILMYATGQLEILQIRFRNFVEPELSRGLEGTSKLEHLILNHQYIIRFVKKFNRSTKYITLMDFLFSSFDIATLSMVIIKMNISEIGWVFFYFALLMIQLFLVGWSCNEIKVQSEGIGDALFQSEWYLLNKEAKSHVQFIIARTKKPLLMNIGPFGPMTTNSILLVLKAAYSYVNITRK